MSVHCTQYWILNYWIIKMDKYWFPAKRTCVHVDTSSESENKKIFVIVLHYDMAAILSGFYLVYI